MELNLTLKMTTSTPCPLDARKRPSFLQFSLELRHKRRHPFLASTDYIDKFFSNIEADTLNSFSAAQFD